MKNNIFKDFTDNDLVDAVNIFQKTYEAVENHTKTGFRQGIVQGAVNGFLKAALLELGKRRAN